MHVGVYPHFHTSETLCFYCGFPVKSVPILLISHTLNSPESLNDMLHFSLVTTPLNIKHMASLLKPALFPQLLNPESKKSILH